MAKLSAVMFTSSASRVCHRLEVKKQLRLPYEVFCVILIAGGSAQLMGSQAVQHLWLWCRCVLNRIVGSVLGHGCWPFLPLSFLVTCLSPLILFAAPSVMV